MLTIAFRDPANPDQAFADMQVVQPANDNRRGHTERLFAVRKHSATFGLDRKGACRFVLRRTA